MERSRCSTCGRIVASGRTECTCGVLQPISPVPINRVTEALRQARNARESPTNEHVNEVFDNLLVQRQEDINAINEVNRMACDEEATPLEFRLARMTARNTLANIERFIGGSESYSSGQASRVIAESCLSPMNQQVVDAMEPDVCKAEGYLPCEDLSGDRIHRSPNQIQDRDLGAVGGAGEPAFAELDDQPDISIQVETVTSDESDADDLPPTDGHLLHNSNDVQQAPFLRRSPRRPVGRGRPPDLSQRYMGGNEPSTPRVPDHSLIQDRCCNCMRTDPPAVQGFESLRSDLDPYTFKLIPLDLGYFNRYSRGRRWRRRYLHLDLDLYPVDNNGTRMGKICGQCFVYLDAPQANNHDGEVVWVSWMWTLLIGEFGNESVVANKIWHLLPSSWKLWWCRSFSCFTGMSIKDLLDEPSLFADVSVDYQQDVQALEKLRWADDLMPREASLCMPTVKCPCGAAEWKHRANTLPIDLVWDVCLETDIPLFSVTSSTNMEHWLRSDYLQVENLYGNPSWYCMPVVAKDKKWLGPRVLCCRYHKSTDAGMMIHPPRHPTGTIATPKSGQFAPVVPIPRTLETAKVKSHSASFMMVQMEGSYVGLDTMHLNCRGGYHHYQNNLAWEQEVLSILCRSDMKFHIAKMEREGRIGHRLAQHLLRDGPVLYPHWDSQREQYEKGSTYCDIDGSVKLHQSVLYSTEETLYTTQNQIGASTNQKRFKPSWPKHITWIHPAGCLAGKRFPSMIKFGPRALKHCDGRVSWHICSMLATVSELWDLVVSTKKNELDWEGHALALVTRRCYPTQMQKTGKSNTVFNGQLSCQNFHDKFMEPTGNRSFNIRSIASKFTDRPCHDSDKYRAVSVMWDRFRPPAETHKTVAIVLKRTPDYRPSNPVPASWLPDQHDPLEWELRYMSITNPKDEYKWEGAVYCRHGGSARPVWWRIDNHPDARKARRQDNEWRPSSKPTRILRHWTVLVYVKKKPFLVQEVRDAVLLACNGQVKYQCSKHASPLILSVRSAPGACVCPSGDNVCGLKGIYRCPSTGCDTAICKTHFEDTREDQPPYFIPQQGLEDGSTVDNADEAVLNDVEMQSDQCSHSTFECSNSDESESLHSSPASSDSSDSLYTDESGDDNNIQNTDNYVVGTRQGMDDFDGYCSDEGNEQQLNHTDQFIPGTNAGLRPIYNVVDTGVYSDYCVSNHAILNFYGGCLIRRNTKFLGSVKQRNFLQRQAATIYGETIPLIYPEGMLYPDIFYSGTVDHSIIGAIPAAMLRDPGILKHHGVASLESHMRCRLGNPGLLSSCNPKYHLFLLDIFSNFCLRGCDSRVILRRGFAEQQGSGGVRMASSEEALFHTDQVDSRACVNKLSAATADDDPAYFYTHTCNMKQHFGLHVIWEWLTSDTLIAQITKDRPESPTEVQHLKKCIIDSSGVLLLRTWMEMVHIWILYITKSPDQPLGEMTKFWFRMELQDAKANVPHLHSILWTTDRMDTEEGMAKVLSRIRGYIQGILTRAEKDELLGKGIFTSEDAIMRLLDTMSSILPHHHVRRCYTANYEGSGRRVRTLICKMVNRFKTSRSPAEHVFEDIPVEHSQEAIQVMQEIGAARPKQHANGSYILESYFDWMKAIKHVPPSHGDEGIISPVPGYLVAINPNSDNIQFPTGYTLPRYLTKYLASVDVYNLLRVCVPPKDDKEECFTVFGEELLNNKVTRNRLAQSKKVQTKRTAAATHARAINIAEFYMHLFNYDPVLTNLEFVKLDTSPFEERRCKERMKPIESLLRHSPSIQNVALTALNTVPCHAIRRIKNLPLWRQFQPSQVQKIQDDLHSPLNTDSVTIFGMRPPEILFVMNPFKYSRWFYRDHKSGKYLRDIVDQETYCWRRIHATDIYSSAWLDGQAKRVLVRGHAIKELLAYIPLLPDTWFAYGQPLHEGRRVKAIMKMLFQSLQDAFDWKMGCVNVLYPNPTKRQVRWYEMLLNRFVCEVEKPWLPVVWMNPVRPLNTHRFLIHLLLSLGSFIDEHDLFDVPAMQDAFVKARLLDPTNATTRKDSANRLALKYFTAQLRLLPAGTFTFDRYCVSSYHIIRALFLHNTFHVQELPTVLYCRLRQDTSDAVAKHIESKTRIFVTNLISTLRSAGLEGLPPLNIILQSTLSAPTPWEFEASARPLLQPLNSYNEQRVLWSKGIWQIKHYIAAKNESTKGLCIVGAGGVGKTTIAMCLMLYARSCGLNIGATAIMSERAQELASEHFNSLTTMPKYDLKTSTPGQMAEKTISRLYQNPEKLEYLRILDVLFFDEAGAASAEVWCIFDIVLRYIRNSSKPFGGLLIISTMDHLQLDPVLGRHPLLSPLFTCTFVFGRLIHSVRAASDPAWQRVQEISRTSPIDLCRIPALESEFVNLLVNNCTWLIDESLAPPGALFVYGKQEPARIQERKMFAKMKASISQQYVVCSSTDFEATYHGRFVPASRQTTSALSRKAREPPELYLYARGRYTITYNKPGFFSNGQLAVLWTLPDRLRIEQRKPVKVLLAPPGSRRIPSHADTFEVLYEEGWRFCDVGIPPEIILGLAGGMKGKRTNQYGLKHYVGSTWHMTMGRTLSSLVTRVECPAVGTSPYSLWEASQVVVLVSRTRTAPDTCIVSRDPTRTARILFRLLSRVSSFRYYISQLLEKLCGDDRAAPFSHPIEIDQGLSIYRPMDIVLPRDQTGFVYILMSLKDPKHLYIGSTKNLIRRFQEHNTGWGARQTALSWLRPWALLAYVCGFDGHAPTYVGFENDWITAKENLIRVTNGLVSPQTIVRLALDLIQERQQSQPHLSLRLVHSGSMPLE